MGSGLTKVRTRKRPQRFSDLYFLGGNRWITAIGFDCRDGWSERHDRIQAFAALVSNCRNSAIVSLGDLAAWREA